MLSNFNITSADFWLMSADVIWNQIGRLLTGQNCRLKLFCLYSSMTSVLKYQYFVYTQHYEDICSKVTRLKGNFDVFWNGAMPLTKIGPSFSIIKGFKNNVKRKSIKENSVQFIFVNHPAFLHFKKYLKKSISIK